MKTLTTALRLGVLGSLAILTTAASATAQIMVVGIDRKFAYDDKAVRQALSPGQDQVMFFDIKDPAKPKLIGSLDLENSILGPPTNVAVTPDQSLALIANSVHSEQTLTGWKAVPADDLFVVDLKSYPPKLVQTVKVGRQPSGIAISTDGKFALVANRDNKTISVLKIEAGNVTVADTVSLEDNVGGIAVTPDGRRVIATKTAVHKAALLTFDDSGKLKFERDLWVGLFPWNVSISPDSKTALVANIGNGGQSDGSAKTISVIDLSAPVPFVREHVSVGDAPEGVAFSPRGDFAALTILQGSYDAVASAWFRKPTGAATLLSIANDKINVVNSVDVGAFPEGVAFSPDGQFVYVGNYKNNSISVLKIAGGKLVDTNQPVALPGPPASLRIGSQ